MAVRSELTLRCDQCDALICTAKLTAGDRAIRADAQLNHGAYCGSGKDYCRRCRGIDARPMLATKVGHSIGTQRQ